MVTVRLLGSFGSRKERREISRLILSRIHGVLPLAAIRLPQYLSWFTGSHGTTDCGVVFSSLSRILFIWLLSQPFCMPPGSMLVPRETWTFRSASQSHLFSRERRLYVWKLLFFFYSHIYPVFPIKSRRPTTVKCRCFKYNTSTCIRFVSNAHK